ncbi:MAG: Small ribosomal subunit biosis GTPase RsgA [Candidatus Saccharibacteria bacterium]|nr:Small ribosomal subunit biosis GTPase RsgA [Candidatus Saccharibacteria bacterium]
MSTLTDFGWTPAKQLAWDQLELSDVRPARVIADFGTSVKIATPHIITAELSGKLAHYASRDETPKVGDWVAVNITDGGAATVESVVLRSNEIARKVAGKQVLKQIAAANVDIAFVLLSLDNDFSVERLKRFLYQLSVSNVKAVIVLNKADKTDDLASYLTQLNELKLPIVVSTATDGSGVTEIAGWIKSGDTAILLGSSGVGKSTLTNKLLGREAQSTNDVRESDSTGKHTTVHRELFQLPGGGMLIDTPGIRELQLWGTESELDINYDDIVDITQQCKYKSCRHTTEEGCAIRQALADGSLDKKHYANYLKMKAELSILTVKTTERDRQANKRPQRYGDKNASSRSYDSGD